MALVKYQGYWAHCNIGKLAADHLQQAYLGRDLLPYTANAWPQNVALSHLTDLGVWDVPNISFISVRSLKKLGFSSE